ncbi:MAG TPA: Hsp20/alpha crystallin family protein [Candidatus Acidoferrales bacterium]|nr:Hsp20/alpha crystallin family protein [Candidatus Acidoferrales bacterium]
MADLIPFNWRESVQRLRQDIGDAFNRWVAKFKKRDFGDADLRQSPVWTSFGPSLELDETDDEVIVRAGMPGLSKNDFKVEVTENRVVVRGEKKSARKSRNRYEESHASFAQALSLPCEIDPNKAKARFKNGLLTISLPKTEKAKGRRIKIPIR